MNKNTSIIVGVVVVLLIIIGALGLGNKKPANAGTLYIGITDATADISNVSDIALSVKGVEVKSGTGAWVKVATDEKVYQLLSLDKSGETKLYTKSYVSAGTYDKVRVSLGDVVIKTKSKGDVKANLPSTKIVIDTKVTVKEKSNTAIKLDILADQSLHTTAKGEYVFAPVIKSESRSSADVSLDGDSLVSSGGSVDDDIKVGVDLSGLAKKDFILKTGQSLDIESEGGKIKFLLGGEVYEDKNVDDDSSLEVKSSTKSDSYLEVDDSSKDTSEDKDNKDGKDDSIDVKLDDSIKIGQ